MPHTQTKQSRTMLVSLLGAFARRTGNWMPINGIVSLMRDLDIDESSVRTGVSRLKKREWLVPEKRDRASGYELAPRALESFTNWDRVIWHTRVAADLADGWCFVCFSVPESDRSRRHLLRSRLSAYGFGNVASGVWVAPSRMAGPANALIEDLELLDNATVFVGSYAGSNDLASLIAQWWDLDEINDRYKTFLQDHASDLEMLANASGPEAFRIYMRAVDDWRRLPLSDPGLPRELLGPDWAGEEAGAVFEAIIAAADASALEHVSRYAVP